MMDDLSMQLDHARRAARMMEILQLYAQKVPVADICAKYECSRSNVQRLVRIAGLKRRRGYPLETRLNVIARLEEGVLYKVIAGELHVSEAYVSMVAKMYGISRYKTSKNRVFLPPIGD